MLRYVTHSIHSSFKHNSICSSTLSEIFSIARQCSIFCKIVGAEQESKEKVKQESKDQNDTTIE
jgi:hypothetical protein